MLPVKGLYGHIAKNNAISLALIAAFVAACVAVGKTAFFVLMTLLAILPSSVFGKAINSELAAIQSHYHRADSGLIGEIGWIVIALSTAYVLIGLLFHHRIIQHFVGSVALNRRDEKRLYNMVEALAIQSGLLTPRVEIIESDALNAYACGWSPKRATIAVTRGLMRGLTDAELNAVLAHEMTHIRNCDTRLSVLSAILGGMIRTQAEAMWYVVRQKVDIGLVFAPSKLKSTSGGTTVGTRVVRVVIAYLTLILIMRFVASMPSGADAMNIMPWASTFNLIGTAVVILSALYVFKGGAGASDGYKADDPWAKVVEPIGVAAVAPKAWWLLSPPIWMIIYASKIYVAFLYAVGARTQSSISRAREFIADAGAIELTKDADALVSALLKIEGRDKVEMIPSAFNAMMISGQQEQTYPTHPTIAARIDAIVRYAAANGHIVSSSARRGTTSATRAAMPLPTAALAFGRRPARLGV